MTPTTSTTNRPQAGSKIPWPRVTAGLALWLAAAWALGESGLLTAGADQFFRPVAFSVVVPLAVMAAAYLTSPRLRAFVQGLDLESLTLLQLWRVVGFGFVLLYAHDVLPALFAFAASFGDLAVGLAAPFVVARLRRDPGYAGSVGFKTFHVMGLLDFALAVATAFLASGYFPALVPAGITSAPMEVWPLNIFPSFGVPIFIALHAAVFLKLRATAKAAHSTVRPAAQAA